MKQNKFKTALLFLITNRSDSWITIVVMLIQRAFFTGLGAYSFYFLCHIAYTQIIGTGYTPMFDTVGDDVFIIGFNFGFSLVGIAISFLTISKSYTSPGQRAYDLEQKRKERE